MQANASSSIHHGTWRTKIARRSRQNAKYSRPRYAHSGSSQRHGRSTCRELHRQLAAHARELAGALWERPLRELAVLLRVLDVANRVDRPAPTATARLEAEVWLPTAPADVAKEDVRAARVHRAFLSLPSLLFGRRLALRGGEGSTQVAVMNE